MGNAKQSIFQGTTQSSYSENETSLLDSTPSELLASSQSDSNEYHTPFLPNNFTNDIVNQPEKINNPFISSISMRSISTNVVKENILSKRPSSLPVFRQNGLYIISA